MTSKYFDDLQRQLVAATAQQNASVRAAPRRRRRALWMTLGLLVTVPAGAAAAAIWQPWTEADGLVRLSPDQSVASGDLAQGGSWRLVRAESSAGRCLELLLTGTPPEMPTRAGGCGNTEGVVGSIGATQATYGLIFGEVPAAVESVEYRDGPVREDAAAVEATGWPAVEATHRYFVMETDVHPDGCLVARDASGAVVSAKTISPNSPEHCNGQ